MLYASLGCFLVIHALNLYGMFDVYFKSPIVPDLPPVPTDYKTPAKRLVLFVGDGLRADHFFNTCHVPFLREIIESGKAVSGVSHTRVPTESRPGTIAIAAGVYEDPSAVFKGWQDNPVPVDSFFNRCRYSFAWGSPDIVHLFSRNSLNVNASSYDSNAQNFDPDVSLFLNKWVLDEFMKFTQECKKKVDCREILYGEKISFFFHFLGIDMAGHKSKPHSESYIQNIQQVDGIVKTLTSFFGEFFQDGDTAFVFTSDHGMTDWGSHGAGSLVETKTPIVAWGPGVKQPGSPPVTSSQHSCQWNTPSDSRFDVKQADIAVLMSTLLGVEIPTNSLGTVPVNYLNFDNATLYTALRLNARQLLVLYHHLERHVKDQVLLPFFRPYSWSTLGKDPDEFLAEGNDISSFKRIQELNIIMEDIKQGIDYYQNYFQNYLLFLLSMSFIGLMLVMIGNIYTHSMPREQYLKGMGKPLGGPGLINNIPDLRTIFIIAMVIVTMLHFAQRLPGIYYIYAMLPINLWWKGLEYLTHPLVKIELKKVTPKKWLILAISSFTSIELLHLSFYYRWLLSVIMVIISTFPWFLPRSGVPRSSSKSRVPSFLWAGSSVVLSIFPLLPTVGVEKQTLLVLFSGLLWLLGMTRIVMKSQSTHIGPQIQTQLTRYQMGLLIAALTTIIYVDGVSTVGTTVLSQTVSWSILGLNFILLVYLPTDPQARLFNLSIAFGIPFMMLSVSFESLFLPLLSLNMLGWTLLEPEMNMLGLKRMEPKMTQPSSALTQNEIRKGFYFLFLIIFSFFGIGNIDSINSFDINWVRCFIGTFSPFTMTALIILKTIMPFFLVSCTLRLIVMETKADPVIILLIPMILCEALGLLFLFKVQNTGSWLDIGRSISHYVIMEVSAFAIVILYAVSGFFIDGTSKRKSRFIN